MINNFLERKLEWTVEEGESGPFLNEVHSVLRAREKGSRRKEPCVQIEGGVQGRESSTGQREAGKLQLPEGQSKANEQSLP